MQDEPRADWDLTIVSQLHERSYTLVYKILFCGWCFKGCIWWSIFRADDDDDYGGGGGDGGVVVMMIPNDSHVFALGLDRLGDMVQKPSGLSKHGI